MKKLFNIFIFYFNLICCWLFSLPIKKDVKMEKLGNVGACWWIPAHVIKKEWDVYLFGAGEDISFDLELIKKYGVNVYSFDPTPRSINYVLKKIRGINKYKFFPWGLWYKNEKIKFFAPQNKKYISHSAVNLQKTDQYFLAECKTLNTIMKHNGHRKIDLLKLDIEGAEHLVLHDILEKRIYPKIILVEFDQPVSIFKIFMTIYNLIRRNYSLVKQDRFNFTFVKF